MTSYVEVGHARQEIASGAARNLEVSHTAPEARDKQQIVRERVGKRVLNQLSERERHGDR